MQKVSIVIPTYNGSKFIGQAIKSCLRQTHTNLEIIIVNDCSTDNTGAIIETFAAVDERIRIINNPMNQKLPGSLNNGFRVATGAFLTWISDDNIFSPHAIETLVKEFDDDQRLGIVYSSYYFMDEAGNKLDSFGAIPEELIFKCSPGACFLYRKAVHDSLGGYDESKFRMEDMDFWLRAATKFTYRYIDRKDLYCYRKHTGSLTSAIYSNPTVYDEYRRNHLLSFRYFFEYGLGVAISDEELMLHLELYFEDIVRDKNWDFNVSQKVVGYLAYLDKLQQLEWSKTGFDGRLIEQVIRNKKERIVSLVINDLVFENQLLQKKQPNLATQLNKPISWYYKEYEVLPSWYKKIGHIIKAIQGNRSWRSLISNEN